MTVDDRRKILDELMRLLPRIAVDHPARMSSLRAFCRLLEAVSLDAGAERDERLFRALSSPSPALWPLARGLLSLRMALMSGLPRQACLDVALAGVLSLSDVHRLAEERIRRPSGQNLRAEVLHLLRCRSERLDGSGPMGLSGRNLDAPVRILAAACAYVDRLADGWSGVRALVSIYGDHAHFDEVCARHLVSILSVYPIGSYVALDSGEKGRVVAARLDDPLHPIVWGRLRADGAVLEPPIRYGRENPAQVVSLLAEPEIGVPGPEETAQAWLQRLHSRIAFWPKGPVAPTLPKGLEGDWGRSATASVGKVISACPPVDRHSQEREQAERLQREEAERLQREQAERLQREEAERLQREQAERLQREEAERLQREEAERLQRQRNHRKRKEDILAAADRVRAAAQGILTRLDRLPADEKAPDS